MRLRAKSKRSKVGSKKHDLERKMADYRRILKDDHDWDYSFILSLLTYKLSRTRHCIVANNIVAGARRTGRQIQRVEVLLQRVIDDSYFEEISLDFHKRYGRIKIVSEKMVQGSRAVEIKTAFARETPQNRNQIRREFRRLMLRADRMKRRDLAKAFSLIEKNIWGWWD